MCLTLNYGNVFFYCRLRNLVNGGQLSSSLVNRQVESKFFPNILNVTNISSKKIESRRVSTLFFFQFSCCYLQLACKCNTQWPDG